MGVTAHILKSLCSQLVAISTDLVPFVYNEYVSKGRKAVLSTLKEILPHLLACYEDVRIIVDGIDESPQGEHKALIKTLCDLTNMSPSCKTLLVSQDIPSIAASLAKKQRLCISGEKKYMLRDMEMVVDSSLTAINDMHNGVIEKAVLQSLKGKILDKAEG
jgi:hypothetical protein